MQHYKRELRISLGTTSKLKLNKTKLNNRGIHRKTKEKSL